jgi:hypothetical protein
LQVLNHYGLAALITGDRRGGIFSKKEQVAKNVYAHIWQQAVRGDFAAAVLGEIVEAIQ